VTREPQSASAPFLIGPKMAKALANPWRNRILSELALRPMSPSEFAEQTGGDLANISRYFRQLRKWGYLEVAEERRGGGRRGAVEHVYRVIQRVHFDTASWEKLPLYLREECSGAIVDSYLLRVTEAIKAGTFDAETNRHLSWKAVSLDRQAWKELTDRLDGVLDWVFELETEAAQRMAETGEEPIPATVGLAAFRSPKPSEVKAKAGRQKPVTDVGR
jgi:DNA-binding transcriptional ArsR family regulator